MSLKRTVSKGARMMRKIGRKLYKSYRGTYRLAVRYAGQSWDDWISNTPPQCSFTGSLSIFGRFNILASVSAHSWCSIPDQDFFLLAGFWKSNP